MQIHGWGNFPTIDAKVLEPKSLVDCRNFISPSPLIARGAGRSYGDSANAKRVLQTHFLDHYHNFDIRLGLLTCEAGVSLRNILELTVPKGWFLPVTPGTSFITLGGAIASDVHGKNHHIDGTFCQHITSLSLLLGTGEIVTASPTEKSDLFHATCGGMGLTGVILSATIKLKAIQSSNIKQTIVKTTCLEDTYEQFELHHQENYSVAWIDSLANGSRLGRSILMLGEHTNDNEFKIDMRQTSTIPFFMPSLLLNQWTIKIFNALYYLKTSHDNTEILPFQTYFYPLDIINNWNKLYGKKGFIQYHFVIPKSAGIKGMRAILTKISEHDIGSFLSVLKMFGPQNKNFLSFPIEGFTLALDFKMSTKTIALVKKLDAMVIDMGGRIYLTKDSLMNENTFKATYSNWSLFEKTREKYGAIGHFSSAQSKRLGLL